MSVVMPFGGDRSSADAALASLCTIERQPGDELIIADNSVDHALREFAGAWPGIKVVPADGERSPGYARNVASMMATNEWLLFIDSDCRPDPEILDHFFASPVGEAEGALAGEVCGDVNQSQLVARYQRDRGYLSQQRNVEDPYRPYAVTANLLVRRAAWHAIGGFPLGMRSSEDKEFTWRLQDAGWKLAYRPDATVVHLHRETVRSFAALITRNGAGRAWMRQRRPEVMAAAEPKQSIRRAVLAALRWWVGGDRERALFRLIDAGVILLGQAGELFVTASAYPERRQSAAQVVVVTSEYLADGNVELQRRLHQLMQSGEMPRVEASRRASRPALEAPPVALVDYWEDSPLGQRLRAAASVICRHPVRAVAHIRVGVGSPAGLLLIAPAAVRLIRSGERLVVPGRPCDRENAAALARLAGLDPLIGEWLDRGPTAVGANKRSSENDHSVLD